MQCANSLKQIGFTHHKLAAYALQRDDALCQQYLSDVSIYQCPTLLFVDEVGTDQNYSIQKYGLSFYGRPLKVQKLLVRRKHLSCIASVSLKKIVATKVTCGSVEGDEFYDFICT